MNKWMAIGLAVAFASPAVWADNKNEKVTHVRALNVTVQQNAIQPADAKGAGSDLSFGFKLNEWKTKDRPFTMTLLKEDDRLYLGRVNGLKLSSEGDVVVRLEPFYIAGGLNGNAELMEDTKTGLTANQLHVNGSLESGLLIIDREDIKMLAGLRAQVGVGIDPNLGAITSALSGRFRAQGKDVEASVEVGEIVGMRGSENFSRGGVALMLGPVQLGTAVTNRNIRPSHDLGNMKMQKIVFQTEMFAGGAF